ncbi:MAG: hypothetical protein K0R12_642 [Gammaproteobacteria bacterium]|nr:hypothetical protein [Gammaproteobacteria bacterium]
MKQWSVFFIALMALTACSTLGSKHYDPDTPQAKSAKLLEDHKKELASTVALSLVYYCKNATWPPQNTIASRNAKLSKSFLSLQNYTDDTGQYHIQFKLKAPEDAGLDINHNPEWFITIPNPPSSEWTKQAIYVPVKLEGSSGGEPLDNIKPDRQFRAECKPNEAWAAWQPEIGVKRFQDRLKAENEKEADTKIATANPLTTSLS